MRISRESMESRTLEDLKSLSNDISRLEAEQESSDIVFITGREETIHFCHLSIFRIRCQNFQDVLRTSEYIKGGKEPVKMILVQTNVFKSFKHYLYSGRLILDNLNIFELLKLSEYFGVSSLSCLSLSYVSSSLTLSSVSDLLNQCIMVFKDDGAGKETLKMLGNFVKENLIALRDSKRLKTIGKDGMIALIKSGVLQLDENEVWRLCIEWARLQVGIDESVSPKHWPEDQRLQIRLVLDGLVQCIRILNIDSAVFEEEVEPTGAVPIEQTVHRYRHSTNQDSFQPKPLHKTSKEVSPYPDNRRILQDGSRGEEDTESRTNPTSKPGSRVECTRAFPPSRQDLRSRQEENQRLRLAEDLSRLNPRVELDPRQHTYQRSNQQNPTKLFHGSSILSAMGTESSISYYEKVLNGWAGTPNQAWTVIFKGSEHAFSAQAFHRMCDGAAPSYVIVKADTGCIGGGYTDIPWSRPVGKGRYVSSDKSFLFSLHNPGRSPAKFEIKKKLFAVSHHPECGPVFGAGADLFICDGCDQQADSYSNLPHSYDGQGAGPESLFGDYSFSIDEYEILVPIQT